MRVDWHDAPLTTSMRPGAMRRIVSGQHSSMLKVVTEPDAVFDGEVHRHVHEQWVVVLAGSLRLVCEGCEIEAGVGDVVYFAPNQWHGATGVGPTGAEYLELSAPVRMDLLPGCLLPSPLERQDSATR